MTRSPKTVRIDPYRVKVERAGAMKTDGLVFADDALMERAGASLEQVANVACLPGIVGNAMAMPDIHWGYGFPIGGVAAFDPARGGIISPGGVGYDINCGVRLHLTGLMADDIVKHLEPLIAGVFSRIPTGVGKGRKDVGRRVSELKRVLRDGAGWAVRNGFGRKSDLAHIEDRGRLDGDPADISDRAMERGRGQLGTLGSGNHFIEFDRVAEIGDPEGAEAFGLYRGQLAVQVHTGSRGLGHQVCSDYIKVMVQASQRHRIQLPDRQLCCAPVESREGRRYLSAMGGAANFAFANRQIIGHQVGEEIGRVLGIGPDELGYRLLYDVCHNIAKLERHAVQGEDEKLKLCVHRKGATRALPPGHPGIPEDYRQFGQPVLVPGDMGTCSYVLAANPEAETETFASCCHGAGRVMSRKQAMKAAKGRRIIDELDHKGVKIRAASRRTVAEEMPEAYKDVSAVVRVVSAVSIARVVAKLEPLAVVKG